MQEGIDKSAYRDLSIWLIVRCISDSEDDSMNESLVTLLSDSLLLAYMFVLWSEVASSGMFWKTNKDSMPINIIFNQTII